MRYGTDIGDDGVETLAEAVLDDDGIMHVTVVRLEEFPSTTDL